MRDLYDTGPVPKFDRPASTGMTVGPPGGEGDVPARRTAAEPMPGIGEELPRAEGVYMPQHDPDS